MARTETIKACRLPLRPLPGDLLAWLCIELDGGDAVVGVELRRSPGGQLHVPTWGKLSAGLTLAAEQAIQRAAADTPGSSFRRETEQELQERRAAQTEARNYEHQATAGAPTSWKPSASVVRI